MEAGEEGQRRAACQKLVTYPVLVPARRVALESASVLAGEGAVVTVAMAGHQMEASWVREAFRLLGPGLRWKFPLAPSALLPRFQYAACRYFEHSRAIRFPNLEQIVVTSILFRVPDDTFPSGAGPRTKPLAWQSFQEVQQLGLQCRLRTDEHNDTRYTGRLGIKRIAGNNSCTKAVENLCGFARCQLAQLGFVCLHGKF